MRKVVCYHSGFPDSRSPESFTGFPDSRSPESFFPESRSSELLWLPGVPVFGVTFPGVPVSGVLQKTFHEEGGLLSFWFPGVPVSGVLYWFPGVPVSGVLLVSRSPGLRSPLRRQGLRSYSGFPESRSSELLPAKQCKSNGKQTKN